MISQIRTLRAELQHDVSLRAAFALIPYRGSDREVGWSSLELDRAAGRRVTYVTAPVDYHAIAGHFPDSVRTGAQPHLAFGPVKVIAWPFDLPPKIFRVGYLRYVLWVIALQLAIAAFAKRGNRTRVHFLTYTQLATPILLRGSIGLSHGPAGALPPLLRDAPVSWTLRLKSRLMWAVLMPVVNGLKRGRSVRTAVVHPSLLTEAQEQDGRNPVLSALNIDYLGDHTPARAGSDAHFDVVVVARDVAFKNLDIVRAAFAQATARHGLRCLVINGSLPATFQTVRNGVTEWGRQDRTRVYDTLANSRLHAMLSVELGGYITLEAASCGVPTLCLDGYGASAMVRPGPGFMIDIRDLRPAFVADRLADLLADADRLRAEALAQTEHARQFIDTNRRQFAQWLHDTA